MVERIFEHLLANPVPHPLIIFLGDYIDRGPSSRQVLDQLIELNKRSDVILLKGNHERYLVDFLRDPSFLTDWLQWGGLDTLRSYGLFSSNYYDAREQELLAMSLSLSVHQQGHFEFLRNLRSSFTYGDFFFVHAGVRPGVPLDQQSEKDLLEIRNDFLASQTDFAK